MAPRHRQKWPRRDRINELPADILDKILCSLPIKEAARMAVLSIFWRNIWLSLTELNFDDRFFDHIRKKYSHAHTDMRARNIHEEYKNSNIWIFAGLYVVNKVLIQHNGLIRKFVFDFQHSSRCPGMITLTSKSFDFDQWLFLITRKGVEDICFSLMPGDEYSLPNCIFFCPTLRRLHVYGVFVGPINDPRMLPNVTSLCFENVYFTPRDHPSDVPMLKHLEFVECVNIHDFNITAQKLDTLIIDSCPFNQLPTNLDLRSIRTLDLDCSSLKGFVNTFNRRELQQQPPELDVEYLMLSGEDYDDQKEDMYSAFTHLLQICPKLCRLEIDLKFSYVMPKLPEEFHTLAQRHTLLRTLRLDSFVGGDDDMVFIKGLLACFPALEEVVIISLPISECYDNYEDFEKDKAVILHFPCASTKVKIIFN